MTNAEDTKPRILLVDDEPQLLAGLQIHLRKHYTVHIAEEGADALELLREFPDICVIVSDMKMPRMTGVEVLRRASQIAPDTTRMLLTGYADRDATMGAVNEGRAFRILTKPCAPPTLLQAVADAVEENRAARNEKAYIRGEQHRVSEKVFAAGRMAVAGALATGAGEALQVIASAHSEALDEVLARARSGAFVSTDDLRELRHLERSMFRAAQSLSALSSGAEEREEIDVRRIAKRATEHLRVLDLAAADVDVVTEFDAGLPIVLANATQIEQVLLNLLKNAVEAVQMLQRPPRICVRVFHDPDRDDVVCEISDNGSGIHPEARPFVMRPYFSTRGGTRIGLGLPVAQKIVEQWGGIIGFESTYGEGTCFRFSLPSATQFTTTHEQSRKSIARVPA